ncbi:MAG: hypothetical protein QXQ53_03465 [Candidatus Methanosuratincola sp.]
MWTLKEAAAAVGYTPDQIRKRLATLGPFLDGAVQRGPRGAILLSEEAVGLIRRIHELEASGHNLREAVALAQGEAPRSANVAQRGPRPEEAELVKILWVLVGILAFATMAMVGLGMAALINR